MSLHSNVKGAAIKNPKRMRLSLERKQNLYGYVFILPVIIGLGFIYLPVIIQSFIYAISEITVTRAKGFQTTFVGLDNFDQALFVEENFLRTVVEAVMGIIAQIPVILIFAFFMANVLNQKFKGRTVARVIFFIPVVISTGIIAQFDQMKSALDIYSGGGKMDITGSGMEMFNYGQLMNLIYTTLPNETLGDIVMGAIDGLYGVITSSGVQMLVFLSGLQSVSEAMFEAAKVEGATSWEVFWKISFPMISPLILVNLIYTVIDLFLKANNGAVVYINEKLNDTSAYALASAFSWIYMAVVLVFVGIVYLLVKKLIIYQD